MNIVRIRIPLSAFVLISIKKEKLGLGREWLLHNTKK
jgi:hypothetical protein